MNIFYFLFNTINGDFMNLIDIMSKNLVVGNVGDDFVKIASIMKDNDIGFVPIVRDKKIVGVITDRDIVVRIISNNDFKSDISTYMTKDVICVSLFDNIAYVLDVMKKHKIKRVIVSDGNKVCGVVSISDILNCGIDKDLLCSIKDIWEVGPNIHKYETKIDDFYL